MFAGQTKSLVFLLIFSILISILSSELIFVIAAFGVSKWAAAAVFHGFIAVLIVFLVVFRPKLNFPKENRNRVLALYPYLPYLPAFAVFVVSLFLAFVKAETPYNYSYLSLKSLITVIFVPIVEEICYRLGLSRLFQSIGGRFWGGYFSVLVFTTMHGLPSIDRILNNQVGFFFGPFLLGIACELLFVWSKQLIPSILLHVACNSSAVVFSLAGGYWLTFFRFLYH